MTSDRPTGSTSEVGLLGFRRWDCLRGIAHVIGDVSKREQNKGVLLDSIVISFSAMPTAAQGLVGFLTHIKRHILTLADCDPKLGFYTS